MIRQPASGVGIRQGIAGWVARAVVLLVAMFGLGCGDDGGPSGDPQCLSFEQARAAFESIVEQNRACTSDDECALVGAECPLGCSTEVRADRAAAVADAAAALVARTRCGGKSCVYRCAIPGTPVCRSNRCVAVALERDSGAP